MKTMPDLAATATARQRKVGDIADWYKGDASVEEQKRLGMHVVVVVDHMSRIIRVEAHDPRFGGMLRTPIEERMEFDYEVLDYIKKALRNPNVAVILDSSDVSGRLSYGSTVSRGWSARIKVVDIDSGEVVDERTFMKVHPEFPQELKMKLLAFPGGVDSVNVVPRTFAAEAFVSAYLRMPT
ncbi:MAG TPA: hypothetical protein VNL35_23750 [Chloroflexota bacterium]|nr:hypothetical protein [Chloroflexota bacterium]